LLYVVEEATDACPGGVVIRAQSSDINALEKQLETKLREQYDVTWSDMICVCVRRHSIDSSDCSESVMFGVSLTRYQAGFREFDGSRCYRIMKQYARGEEWKTYDRIFEQESPIQDHDRLPDRKYGIIEYSEENWSKLVAVVDAINALNDKLVGMFIGEALKEQLALMSVDQPLELQLVQSALSTT
jgi:hypothetical protein